MWTEESIQALNQIVRECRFDWNEVRLRMRSEFGIEVSASDCRVQFASNNEVKISLPTKKETEISSASANATDDDSDHGRTNNEKYLETFASYSLEQLIDHVAQQELRIKERKEEIFQRILTSLTAGEDTPSTLPNLVSGDDEAVQSFRRQQIQREEQQLLAAQRQREAAERDVLEAEKIRLKQRFAEGSEDSAGDNPLLALDSVSSHNKFSAEQDEFTASAGANTILLESDELDVVLEELEKELFSKAQDKHSDGAFATDEGDFMQ